MILDLLNIKNNMGDEQIRYIEKQDRELRFKNFYMEFYNLSSLTSFFFYLKFELVIGNCYCYRLALQLESVGLFKIYIRSVPRVRSTWPLEHSLYPVKIPFYRLKSDWKNTNAT